MAPSSRSRSTDGFLVYDGDCAFCTTAATWLSGGGRVDVRPWQRLDLERYGLTLEQVTTAVQWVDGHDVPRASAAAAIAVSLRHRGRFWAAVGACLGARPVIWVAEPVYRWVARNRHRLPGATPACALDPQD